MNRQLGKVSFTARTDISSSRDVSTRIHDAIGCHSSVPSSFYSRRNYGWTDNVHFDSPELAEHDNRHIGHFDWYLNRDRD